MLIEILDGLGKPIVIPATRVVVRGNQGTPLMAAAEWGDAGAIRCVHLDDPAFQQVLRSLGVADTVVIQTVKVPTAADFRV